MTTSPLRTRESSAAHRHLVATERLDVVAEHAETVDEQGGHGPVGATRHDPDPPRRRREQSGDGTDRRTIDRTERSLEVREPVGERPADNIVRRSLPNPLGGRAKAIGELRLNARLETPIPLEAQVVGEPDDGGAGRVGLLSERGHRAEGHRIRMGKEHVDHAALGGGEIVTVAVDHLDQSHETNVTMLCPA